MNNSIIPSSGAGYPIPASSEDYAAPSSPTGVRRIAFFVRKLWWVPLLTLLLGLGAAAGYNYKWAPPHYASSASMWETEKFRLPEGASFSDNIQDYMGTQMELLRNGLEQKVVEHLRQANSSAVPTNEYGQPIKMEVTVRQAPKSTILIIEAVSTDPAYSQTYLDALLNEYTEYKRTVRKSVSGYTLATITEQVMSREKELQEAQSNLNVFQRSNNLTILQEEGTVAGGYLAKLQTELSDLKMESLLLDSTVGRQEQAAAGNTNLSPDLAYSTVQAGLVSTPPATAELAPYQEIQLLKSEREKLSKNLRPAHPKIVKLDSQIERDEKIIEMFRHQAHAQFAASRQNIKTKMENVQASIKDYERKIVEANNCIAEAEGLKFRINRAQSLYDRLDTILQTVTINRNIDQETLTTLAPASPAQRTYSSEIRLLMGSGIGGLLFGFCLVALIGIRDDRFTTLAEVNEKFGDVIVGQVPNMPKMRGEAYMPLLQSEDHRDMYAESYRSLRSALLYMPREGEAPKILLITSALPDEGKSTIASNLARTLALGGSRVLLVDGDLRRGYLHDLLGLRLAPGLVDLLDRPEDLETIVQTDSLPNFSFLSRGKSVPNPGDLFLSPKMEKMFVRLREKFDYVIIDSSPIFAADDAASLAPKVDGTLFVVRSRFSPAGAVKEALDLLGQRQVRVLGLVFNRAETTGRSYYYYKNPEYYRSKTTA
jgi:capsular exopolysaccharide synthesis family protein